MKARALALCALLAACAQPAPPVAVECPPTPPVILTPAPVPVVRAQPIVTKQRVLVAKEHRVVAEAGRYVAWKRSKTPIISRLTILTKAAQDSVNAVVNAKSLKDKTEHLPAAEDAVGALEHYLCCEKGD